MDRLGRMIDEMKQETPEDAELRLKLSAIMNDSTLNPIEKARQKQALMNAKWLANAADSDDEVRFQHCAF